MMNVTVIGLFCVSNVLYWMALMSFYASSQ